MKLEICIPTFNRPANLQRTLARLLPQLRDDVGIAILDNCSEPPVEPLNDERVRLIRNRVNIGGDANILRCFEACEADYMWLLGDDDAVASDAVDRILASLSEFPSAVFHGFKLSEKRATTRLTTGLREFIEAISFLGDMWLISNGVYHVASFHPSLPVGYRFAYAYAPHLALLLETLSRSNAPAVISRDSVVTGNDANSDNMGWSIVRFSASRMALLDFELPDDLRQRLGRLIFTTLGALNHSFVYCVDLAHRGSKSEARRLFCRVYETSAPYADLKFRVKGLFYSWLLHAPSFSNLLLKLFASTEVVAKIRQTEKRHEREFAS